MICATAERTSRPGRLCDIVDYAAQEDLPSVPWLRRLPQEPVRRDARSLSRSTRITKRVMDVVLSLVALIVLAPVMLLIAMLVKVTSPGGAIFQQTRVGLNLRRGDRRQADSHVPWEAHERRTQRRDRRGHFTYGRHFTLYKFRTMRNDAERDGAQFAVEGDARVTPLGRFLRRTRLDELPQLWNVLRGEMSLVGPRPERPEFIEELSEQIPDYLQRLGLKPGLTGVAQVVNGYDNNLESFRRKVAFDLLYLRNCSVFNDLRIMARTFRVVCSGQGL
ncbi:MAG: sugar transferase [Planctomycetaceae bacterium]|nr:sugar transferase [Planctomycetaceae bacterium]